MGEAAKSLYVRYTWHDYRSWPDSERWQIVGGEACDMSPPPLVRHQDIVVELSRQFANFFLGKKCRPYVAPVSVVLSDEDIVQPDLLVVCEPEKIKRDRIEGAPTLVVEVLSPSTTLLDRGRKLKLYERSGVRELWLVTPHPSAVEVLALDGGAFRIHAVHGPNERFNSVAFPDLTIDLATVFASTLEEEEPVMRLRETRPSPSEANRRMPDRES